MKGKSGWCKNTGALRSQLAALLMAAPLSALAEGDNNLYMRGALVAEPCVIAQGDEEITLDFGTINDKYLYLNTRTLGKNFEIHLEECDLTQGKMVSVTFTGKENHALPGLLDVDGGSGAKGIGIGFETLSAKPLLLNTQSGKSLLQEGGNIIALRAYVKGEPLAIADKTIGQGSFNAVATFNLEYE